MKRFYVSLITVFVITGLIILLVLRGEPIFWDRGCAAGRKMLLPSIKDPSKCKCNLSSAFIDANNLIVVYCTLRNNKISLLRAKNLKYRFRGIDTKAVIGVTKGSVTWRSYLLLRNLMQEFIENQTHSYGILCDDDMDICPKFLQELNRTVQDLPSNWKVLHLCPGCLWGRAFPNRTKLELCPEPASFFAIRPGFTKCNRAAYNVGSPCWYGGPVAMLVNRTHVQEIMDNYDRKFAELRQDNDVVLTHMAMEDPLHFVAMDPPLCNEKDQGASTLQSVR